MAILCFIGFCMIAVPVNSTALSFTVVAWAATPKPSTPTRLSATVGGLGSVLVTLVVGVRLFIRALHGRSDHG